VPSRGLSGWLGQGSISGRGAVPQRYHEAAYALTVSVSCWLDWYARLGSNQQPSAPEAGAQSLGHLSCSVMFRHGRSSKLLAVMKLDSRLAPCALTNFHVASEHRIAVESL
jgi:hypothetical protein